MKLFKESEQSNLYQLHELTEDDLIFEYNINLNYMEYIKQLLALPDNQLAKAAPGPDIKVIRNNLTGQLKTCEKYIAMWSKTIEQGKQDVKQN